MLYHSPFKHFVKGLLGRKNDAWYFDRMIATYDVAQQQITTEALQWASKMSAQQDEAILAQPLPPHARLHPLYQPALQLRNNLLQQQAKNRSMHGWQVLIHMPPDSFSPGWASWFGSLGQAMELMGASVQMVWENWSEESVSNADLILSQANPSFVQHWPAYIKQCIKPTAIFACYCSFENNDEQAANLLYQDLRSKGVNLLLNAADEAYIGASPHTGWATAAAGLRIASLSFAANPLRHYPAPWFMPKADYVFLGSANYDKAKRYHDFFYPVIKKHKGIIAGQGWPWTNNYTLDIQRDRWMYAGAKIGINLHLQSQVDNPTEINERTYILFATGTPQIIDRPALLHHYFQPHRFTADTPSDFLNCFDKSLLQEDLLWESAFDKIEEIFEHHTVFHRIEFLMRQIPQN